MVVIYTKIFSFLWARVAEMTSTATFHGCLFRLPLIQTEEAPKDYDTDPSCISYMPFVVLNTSLFYVFLIIPALVGVDPFPVLFIVFALIGATLFQVLLAPFKVVGPLFFFVLCSGGFLLHDSLVLQQKAAIICSMSLGRFATKILRRA